MKAMEYMLEGMDKSIRYDELGMYMFIYQN